jgi:hypothetical protein
MKLIFSFLLIAIADQCSPDISRNHSRVLSSFVYDAMNPEISNDSLYHKHLFYPPNGETKIQYDFFITELRNRLKAEIVAKDAKIRFVNWRRTDRKIEVDERYEKEGFDAYTMMVNGEKKWHFLIKDNKIFSFIPLQMGKNWTYWI